MAQGAWPNSWRLQLEHISFGQEQQPDQWTNYGSFPRYLKSALDEGDVHLWKVLYVEQRAAQPYSCQDGQSLIHPRMGRHLSRLSLQAMSSYSPYHCPLVLTCEATRKHTRRLRFEFFWTRLDGFDELVQST